MGFGNNLQSNVIDMNQWTFFDKIMYGGLGYGAFCLPTNFIKIIITVVFPPLGEIIHMIGNYISADFPYLNWQIMYHLIKIDNINRIIYSFILTTLFYIPGLVYTLSHISDTNTP